MDPKPGNHSPAAGGSSSSAVKTVNLCSNHKSIGTLNCVVALKDYAVVGVDSRVSHELGNALGEKVNVLYSDDFVKVHMIALDTVITLAGDLQRNVDLLQQLQNRCPQNIQDAANMISQFLNQTPVIDDRKIELLLIGYNHDCNVLNILHIGDGLITNSAVLTEGNVFAIGSGAVGAHQFLIGPMPQTFVEAVKLLERLFVGGALSDVATGGLLRLAFVAKNCTYVLPPTYHVIDSLLKNRLVSPLCGCVLIFSKEPHSIVNCKAIDIYLQRNDCKLFYPPACLGYIDSAWTCFILDFTNAICIPTGNRIDNPSSVFFNSGRPIGNLNAQTFRQMNMPAWNFVSHTLEQVGLVVMKFDYSNLHCIRVSNLLNIFKRTGNMAEIVPAD